MRTLSTRAIAILMVGMVVSLVGSPVPAETVYYTDFSDIATTGGFPDDWTSLDTVGTWVVDEETDEFVLSAVSDDSMVVCDAAGTLTDFTVSAQFHKNASNCRAGVVGRVQDVDNYYSLRVTNNNYLELLWVAGESYLRMKRVTLSPYYADNDLCTISMTFEGWDITCEVRNSSDVVIGQLTATDVDEHFASGKAGLRANNTSFGCSEFQIDVVPEPGAVALLISALAGLLIVRRKR